MSETQSRISDERLAEIVDAGTNCFKICVPSEGENLARELTALRASHKRLVEVAGSVPFRFAWCSDSDEHGPFCRCGRRELTVALAEARKLEGK